MEEASNLSIVIFTTAITILSIKAAASRKDFMSYQNVIVYCYGVVMFLGIPITYILSDKFSFSRTPQEFIELSAIYSLAGLIAGIITLYLLKGRALPLKIAPHLSKLEYLTSANIFILISIFSIVFFVLKNQGFVIFKSASYVDRYESNLGLGLITKLFPFFILGLTMKTLMNPTKATWSRNFKIGSLIGIITYLAMGGFRQIFLIHVFIFLFIGCKLGHITAKRATTYGLSAIPLMAILAVFRYGDSFSGQNSNFTFLILTLDSFSPFESFSKILEYYEYGVSIPGTSLILNEFYSLIPRVLWPEKPQVILNAANYFTTEVLRYETAVTISPTMAGSMYLIGGIPFSILSLPIAIIILKLFDDNLHYYAKKIPGTEPPAPPSHYLRASIYYFLLFYLFGLAREGVDVFLRISLTYLLIIISVVIISKMAALRTKKK